MAGSAIDRSSSVGVLSACSAMARRGATVGRTNDADALWTAHEPAAHAPIAVFICVMQFVAVFAYEVDEGSTAAFEAAYGPSGEWARFFGQGTGYVGTELWRPAAESPGRYLVIDRWRSASAYESFLVEHEAAYRRRSEGAERLYRAESVVGRFAADP
jgi:heme-degrading monooxygenase HmoA